MNLYKITTYNISKHYYVVALDPTAAQEKLEKLLNEKGWDFTRNRTAVKIELIADENDSVAANGLIIL